MTCHNCRIDAPKHGKHRNGLQRFRCSQCSKTFTEPHPEAFRVEMYLEDPRGILALQMLTEGNSIRSVERMTGLHRNIVMQILVIAGERCEELLAREVRNVPVADVQCDEIWGFVQKKESNRHSYEEGYQEIGDAWCFVAFERNTKMVLTYELGKRNMDYTMRFLRKLSFATSPDNRFQLSTDGFRAYPTAVARTLGNRVDFAQLIKIYAAPMESERRYSPPIVVDTVRKPIFGNPDMERICTSHVERQNLTMRMQISRG